MTPDVNVLVAASRSDHPHHKVVYAWLDEALAACANGGTLRLLPMVVASYLRLVTNVRIFVDATPVESAVDFIDALSTEPGVEMPAVGAEWPLLRQMCLKSKSSRLLSSRLLRSVRKLSAISCPEPSSSPSALLHV